MGIRTPRLLPYLHPMESIAPPETPALPSVPSRPGRVTRGFDFSGVDFTPGARLASGAVSLAHKTEKTARLHGHLSSVALAKEEGASPERIGRHGKNWQRHLRGIAGGAVSRARPVFSSPLSPPAALAGGRQAKPNH